TALVAYRMAVQPTESGGCSWVRGTAEFALAGAGGVAIGLGVGVMIVAIRRRLTAAPDVENAVSLLTPFAAYIPAERLGASGILAVVAVGLYVARQAPRILSPETRLEATTMWEIVTFVLEGLIFILVGLDLPLVMRAIAGEPLRRILGYGAIVSIIMIAVRIVWVFPSAYLPRLLDAWRGRAPNYPSWRAVLFVG